MSTTESISNNEKIFLVIFFDLIEKEEVFLNEYLLFQKNRKYDKYTDEIKCFFKVKKVTSRKTFYTQPHDVTFLQNTFINLDSRKDKKYYYFMYNSDWSPNQQKMLLHNVKHISKYFCLDDEICQRLIDLKSTTCANIFSLKGDMNMLKYISKLEENGITYSQLCCMTLSKIVRDINITLKQTPKTRYKKPIII